MAADLGGARGTCRRSVALLGAVFAVLFALVALPVGSARAQYVPPGYVTPEFSGVAGTKISGIGLLADASCTNVRNVVIRFGDGTSGPPDTSTVEGAGTRISGSHTYAAAGDYLGAVDLDATCTNNLGVPSDQHGTGNPGGYPLGFIVHVAGKPSCSGTTATARFSQVIVCPIPGYVPVDYKTVADELRRAYLRGGNQNRAIADIIDKYLHPPGLSPVEDYVLGKELDKLPYSWVLSVPRWAEYADYLKAIVLRRIADDPPDPQYRQLAGPPALQVPKLSAGGRLRRGVAKAANAIFADQGADAALHLALLTTIERAAGAHEAGDADAERRQTLHASELAVQLANVLTRERRTLTTAQHALSRNGARPRLSAAAVHRSRRGGMIATTRRQLVRLGLSDAEVRTAAQEGATIPDAKLAGTFPAVLGLDREARLLAQEVQALHAFAAKHAAGT